MFQLELQEARDIAIKLGCCSSRDNFRPHLNGICIENSEDGYLALASDGHRLGKLRLKPIGYDKEAFSIIIPMEAVEWLRRLPKRTTEQCYVGFDFTETEITFSVIQLGFTAKFKLVDTNFVDWRRVVPSYTSEPTVGFNSTYLSDILSAIGKNEIIGLQLNESTSGPATIHTNDENLMYVLMPARF